jgi:hypothetical protein
MANCDMQVMKKAIRTLEHSSSVTNELLCAWMQHDVKIARQKVESDASVQHRRVLSLPFLKAPGESARTVETAASRNRETAVGRCVGPGRGGGHWEPPR